MSPVAVLTHLAYVIFSLTVMGMFYDGHRLAPFLEFSRCSFLFFYSYGEISILSNSISWSGISEIIGGSVESQIYLALRCYFFLSALVWGLFSTYHTTGHYLLTSNNSKMKL